MKVLGLVVSDKKIFENCILKTYILTPWPTYATNWNGLNKFDRGPPRDHSCEVWSKFNKRFQRRCCLKKLLTDGRTDARTDDGHWRITKAHLSTLCSGELTKSSKVNNWTVINTVCFSPGTVVISQMALLNTHAGMDRSTTVNHDHL